MLTKNDYIGWLKAAYQYYIGTEYVMSDAEWDFKYREFYNNKDIYPAEDFPIVHDPRFDGAGSLFWLTQKEYPEDAKINP